MPDDKRLSPHPQAISFNFPFLKLLGHLFTSFSAMAAVPYQLKALIAAGIKPSKESYIPILVDDPYCC